MTPQRIAHQLPGTKLKLKTKMENQTDKSKQTNTAVSGAAPCSALWVVMKAQPWDALSVGAGWPLRAPDEGPHRFLPVFNTREQAVKWAGGDDHVVMVVPNDKLTRCGEETE